MMYNTQVNCWNGTLVWKYNILFEVSEHQFLTSSIGWVVSMWGAQSGNCISMMRYILPHLHLTLTHLIERESRNSSF